MNQVLDRLSLILKEGRRIVFLGVGSQLRADDSVGLFIVDELSKVFQSTPEREFRFYLGELAPENFTGVIRDFNPTHVILVDAADFEAEPGSFQVIDRDEIGGTSFSTHVLPLKIVANYLVTTTGCEVTVIGVQPKDIEFDHTMTQEVKKGAENFITECKARFKN